MLCMTGKSVTVWSECIKGKDLKKINYLNIQMSETCVETMIVQFVIISILYIK